MAGAPDLAPRRRTLFAALILACLAASGALAQDVPTLTRPVTDLAGVIDTASEVQLERMIVALQQTTGDSIAVLTVKTIAPFADVREYAVRQFENNGRGIGEKGKDNGLLVVLAMDERRVQVEVGYGLEGIITDGFSGETSRLVMAPAFREGQYGRGLALGVARLIGRIAEAKHVTIPDLPRQEPRSAARRSGPSNHVVIAIVVIIVLAQLLGGRGGRRRGGGVYWGGGPWSGWGGGGFGGGGFGGGGFGGGGGGGGFGGFGGGRSGGGGGGAGW